MVALLAGITIMLIMLGAGAPAWRYVVQDMNEEELLFRGAQIADAISAYQKANGNTCPSSLEMLVKGKFLRKAYADPVAKDGRWRLIHQGEAVIAGATRTQQAPSPSTGIVGVASRSTGTSLRIFNNRTRYDEWLFVAGQPRVVGRPTGPRPPRAPEKPD